MTHTRALSAGWRKLGPQIFTLVTSVGLLTMGLVSEGVSAQPQSGTEADGIYSYRGPDGRTVYVNGRERVPEEYRGYAGPIARSSDASSAVFRYRNGQGRDVYVGDPTLIPEAHLETLEEVDLTHISLNEELAGELGTAIDAQYAQVLSSDYCDETRAQSGAGWIKHMLQTNGYLILVLAAMALLLLLTPWAVKRLEPGTWTKVLAYALPLLVFVGVLSHAVAQTAEMRENLLADAQDCEPLGASEGDSGLAVATQKQSVIQNLRSKVEAAHGSREEFLGNLGGATTPRP